MNVRDGEHGSFIRVREVISSTPWGGWVKKSMPENLRRRFFMVFWSEARLRRHLEMLKAFGFNSIRVGFNPCIAWWVGADAQEWRQRQLFRCRTARELGMSVVTGVWGAAIADATKGGQQFSELDWHKSEDRACLEAWYRNQAEIAPFSDRVTTHWVDPGHPQQGGINTVVEMHNVILRIYREKNPKIRGALSTWFMSGVESGHRYPGYEGPGKLAAHPMLERDTDVAVGLMNYFSDGVNLDPSGELKASDLDAIAAAGRRAGVWGWYTTDNEVQPALHVRTDALQNYFRSLPFQTRTALAWHSLDDNFSGLNMQNLYVAGKLMQDPSLDAQKLLDKFVTGFVSEANAAAVAAALRAVEQARTRSRLYQTNSVDAVVPEDVKKKDRHPLPATWLDKTATAVDAALRGMQTVKLAPDFTPAWPVTMEPQEYLVELKAHLEAIRQMLAFLKAAEAVECMKAAGEPAGKLETAISILPKVIYDPAHTAGLEAAVYQQKLAALRKEAYANKT